jgi:predicted small secreted protein
MCSTSTAVTCGHGINPHAIHKHGYHAHFNVSVWAEIVRDAVVSAHPSTLQADCSTISGVLEDIPLSGRKLWFQQTRASEQYGKDVQQ